MSCHEAWPIHPRPVGPPAIHIAFWFQSLAGSSCLESSPCLGLVLHILFKLLHNPHVTCHQVGTVMLRWLVATECIILVALAGVVIIFVLTSPTAWLVEKGAMVMQH